MAGLERQLWRLLGDKCRASQLTRAIPPVLCRSPPLIHPTLRLSLSAPGAATPRCWHSRHLRMPCLSGSTSRCSWWRSPPWLAPAKRPARRCCVMRCGRQEVQSAQVPLALERLARVPRLMTHLIFVLSSIVEQPLLGASFRSARLRLLRCHVHGTTVRRLLPPPPPSPPHRCRPRAGLCDTCTTG